MLVLLYNKIYRRDYCHFYSFPLRPSDIIFITFFLLLFEYYTPETKKSKEETIEEVMQKNMETEIVITFDIGRKRVSMK